MERPSAWNSSSIPQSIIDLSNGATVAWNSSSIPSTIIDLSKSNVTAL